MYTKKREKENLVFKYKSKYYYLNLGSATIQMLIVAFRENRSVSARWLFITISFLHPDKDLKNHIKESVYAIDIQIADRSGGGRNTREVRDG